MSVPDLLMRRELEEILGDGEVSRGRELLNAEIQSLDRPVERYDGIRAAYMFLAGFSGLCALVALAWTFQAPEMRAGSLGITVVAILPCALATLAVAWGTSLLQFDELPPQAVRWVSAIPVLGGCSRFMADRFRLIDRPASPIIGEYLERFATGERTAFDKAGAAIPTSLFKSKLSLWLLAEDADRRRRVRGFDGTRLISSVYIIRALPVGDQAAAATSSEMYFLCEGTLATFEQRRDRFVSAEVELSLQNDAKRILNILRREAQPGPSKRWHKAALDAVESEFGGRMPYRLGRSTVRTLLKGTYKKGMIDYFRS